MFRVWHRRNDGKEFTDSFRTFHDAERFLWAVHKTGNAKEWTDWTLIEPEGNQIDWKGRR